MKFQISSPTSAPLIVDGGKYVKSKLGGNSGSTEFMEALVFHWYAIGRGIEQLPAWLAWGVPYTT
jgi:hypothetical protein